jgi:hypothetical protein
VDGSGPDPAAVLGGEPVTCTFRPAGDLDTRRFLAGDREGYLHLGRRDAGASRWSFDRILAHPAPVASVVAWEGWILTSDRDGRLKIWRDPPRALGARSREPVRAFARAAGFDGRRLALLERGDGVELLDVASGGTVRRFEAAGVVDAALTRDGWTAVALAGVEGRRELLLLAAVGEERIARWDAPLADATGVWPIDRPGARLAVLGNPRGAFQVIEMDRRAAVGPPRTWGEPRELAAVLSDPFGNRLALLDREGSVSVGGLKAGRPDWRRTGRGVVRIGTTTDGKQLVMLGRGGALSVTSFSEPGEVVGPCGPEQRPRPAAAPGGLASCMERPGIERALLLAPFDARRVLLVAAERFVVYDLARGGPAFGYRLRRVDRVFTGGSMEQVLLERETAEGFEYSTIPTAAWILGDRSALLETVARATGLGVKDGDIAPLTPEEWSKI